MSRGQQQRYCAPRRLSSVQSIGARTEEPQRLGASAPEPKCERPLNRRDAMTAEKTAGETILFEMHDSGLLHCDECREKSVGERAQTHYLLVSALRVKSKTASARGHSCPQQVEAVCEAHTSSERLGVRTLLRTRMSARRFSYCLAALRLSRLCGLTHFPTNAWLYLGPRDP